MKSGAVRHLRWLVWDTTVGERCCAVRMMVDGECVGGWGNVVGMVDPHVGIRCPGDALGRSDRFGAVGFLVYGATCTSREREANSDSRERERGERQRR